MSLWGNRILLSVASLLVVGAAYVGIDQYRSGQEEVLSQFRALQNLLVKQTVREARIRLQEYGRDLQSLAKLPSLQSRDAAQIQMDFQAYYDRTEHRRPVAICVLDDDGLVVASTSEKAGRNDFSGSDFDAWAKRRESADGIYLSTLAQVSRGPSGFRSNNLFLMAKQVRLPTPELPTPRPTRYARGIILMTIDLEAVLKEQLAQLNPQSKSQRIWIMDQEGTILLQSEHPEMAQANINRVSSQCAQCHVSFDYAQRMLTGKTGYIEYQLRDHPKKLAAFAPLRYANASWILVLNTPGGEVTAFVQRSYLKMLLLLGVIAGALTLGGMAIQRLRLKHVQAEAEIKRWQEKLQLEEQLRRSEERYRLVFEQSPDGVLMVDPDTLLPLDFNETAHRQLGYSREEFARLRVSDYEVAGITAEAWKQAQQWVHKDRIVFETQHRTKSGQIRQVEVISQTLELRGKLVRHCLYHDITERKRAREILEHRAVRMEALYQASLSIMAQTDSSSLFQAITNQAMTLFQATAGGLFLHRPEMESLELVTQAGVNSLALGASVRKGQGLVGRAWETGSPLVKGVIAENESSSQGDAALTGSVAMAAPIRWGEIFVGVLHLASDQPTGFSREEAVLFGLFATEAAIAIHNGELLGQTRRDAAIKTTLLHDVNHRVKNNLMRLVEIVRLERERAGVSDTKLHAAFNDLESRVQGMGIVHSMLSTTRWGPLSLGELAAQVVSLAVMGSPIRQQPRVTIVAPSQAIDLLPEQATAVAMILNELATNSVKHAFKNGGQGQVEVRLTQESQAPGRPRIHVEYRDDGPGWPEAVLRGESKQVGLQLIEASVRSPLRGELRLRNDHGAVADLAFLLALNN